MLLNHRMTIKDRRAPLDDLAEPEVGTTRLSLTSPRY